MKAKQHFPYWTEFRYPGETRWAYGCGHVNEVYALRSATFAQGEGIAARVRFQGRIIHDLKPERKV